MKTQTEKLMRVSKWVHRAITVLLILFFIAPIALIVLVYTFPDGFYIANGNIRILPPGPALVILNIRSVVAMFAVLGALLNARKMFKLMREGELPFSYFVISRYKAFATNFIILGAVADLWVLALALVAFAIGHVFEYGRLLQEDNDKTL